MTAALLPLDDCLVHLAQFTFVHRYLAVSLWNNIWFLDRSLR